MYACMQVYTCVMYMYTYTHTCVLYIPASMIDMNMAVVIALWISKHEDFSECAVGKSAGREGEIPRGRWEDKSACMYIYTVV